MKIIEFLSRLNEKGISIDIKDDQLEITGSNEELTPDILSELKKNKTNLITFLKKRKNGGDIIRRAEKKEYYGLSSQQMRLLVLYQLDIKGIDYILPFILSIPNELEKAYIEKTINIVIKRYEVLKTYFITVKDKTVQMLDPEAQVQIKEHFIEKKDEKEYIQSLKRPFDLSVAPLLDAHIIRVKDCGSKLVINMHHIICDAISNEIIRDELFSLSKGENIDLPEFHYHDYSEWQRWNNKSEKIQKQESYWDNLFAKNIPLLNLPIDSVRKNSISGKGEEISVYLNSEICNKLRSCSNKYSVTNNIMLNALFNILLSKLCYQEDIIVGLTVNGRNHPNFEKIVGMLVNSLPLMCKLEHDKPFDSYLNEVKAAMLLLFDNQDYPFENLVKRFHFKRELGRNPLFDVMYNYIAEVKKEIDFTTYQPNVFEYNTGSRLFDLTFNITEFKNTIYLCMQYDSNLFNKHTIKKFLKYYISLINSLDSFQNKCLKEISLIGDKEIILVENDLNNYVIESHNEANLAQLSFHQERLWFLEKFDERSQENYIPYYHNIPLILNFSGELNKVLLEQVIKKIISKHKILRTSIIEKSDEAFQTIVSLDEFYLTMVYASDNEFDKVVEGEISAPFNKGDLMMRATLISNNENKYTLICVFHHFIIDRFTIDYIAKELIRLYSSPEELNELDINENILEYAGFSLWQRESLTKILEHYLSYWKMQFNHKARLLELPIQKTRQSILKYSPSSIDVLIPSQIVGRLINFEKEHNIEVKTILLAAFKILLHKYCNQEDVVVGTIMNNRKGNMTPNVFGPISNLLPIRSNILSDSTFIDYLLTLNDVYESAIKYGTLPFGKLVNILDIEKDPSRNALFDVLFQYENNKLDLPSLSGMLVSIEESNLGYGKYDLNIFLRNCESFIKGKLVYNNLYYSSATMELFIIHYIELLNNLLIYPKIKIADIKYVPEKEEKILINQFNNSEVLYPKSKTIIDLFNQQVKNNSYNVAVRHDDQSFTYSFINSQAEKYALYLQKCGCKPNDIIGVLLDRSVDVIISMLAILKTGCIYLPIEVESPHERKNYIIEDSKVKFIITSKKLDKIEGSEKSSLFIEDIKEERHSCIFVEHAIAPSDLCYIIYTSGTTGNPKGVMVEHKSVVRLFYNDKFQFKFDSSDVWTMFHSHSFDFSVWEIYGALLYGGRVNIISKIDAIDTRVFLRLLKKECVTVLNQTPSAFNNLNQEESNFSNNYLNLKYLIFGGEELSPLKLKAWNLKYPEVKIINMYGITETTVHNTYKEIGRHEIENDICNIGKPLPTTAIYLLDKHRNVVPRGGVGEIYIGGEGLARGYVNNVELENEKFIDNPFNSGDKLYRSGDLAKITESGELEYLGRLDNQVQLRGFRIELSEIEANLDIHEKIIESVVICKMKDGNKHLIAYYVSDIEIDNTNLRNYLSKKLPEYMIPSFFIHLRSIPLTINGKVDKESLPEPEFSKKEHFQEPINDIEKSLLYIWSELLEIDKAVISTNEEFFELGGHSILAIKLLNQIQKEFNINISLPSFFQTPTIEGLAELLSKNNTFEDSDDLECVVDEENRYAPFPLTEVQEAYWIGRRNLYDFGNIGAHVYNEFLLEELDIDLLNKVMNVLIERHSMFRAIFNKNGKQIILENTPRFEAKILDLRNKSRKEAEKLFFQLRTELSHKVYSGNEWPLFEIYVTIFDDGTFKVHLSMDHLVIDAGSLFILQYEVGKLFKNINAKLPSVDFTFRDYVINLERFKNNKLFKQSQDYWLSRIDSLPLSPELPIDIIVNQIDKPEFRRISSYLSREDWNKIKLKSKKLGITYTTFIIGCVAEVMNLWSKTDHFMLNLTLYNRIPFHQDVENIIGDFTSLSLIEIDYRSKKSFSERLKEIQNRLWEDLEHRHFGGVEVMREMSRRRKNNILMPLNVTSLFGLNKFKDEQKENDQTTKYDTSINIDVKKDNYSVTQTSQLWIDFNVEERFDEGLAHYWDYLEGLFPGDVLSDMFNACHTLIQQLVDNELLWDSSELVSIPNYMKKNRDNLNSTSKKLNNCMLHELFIEQVEKNKNSIAIETKYRIFTYEELNYLSDCVCQVLRSHEVKPNQLVGIIMEKGWEQIVACLGILKSGAAYLPIDSDLPIERINLLLESGGVEVIVTTTQVLENHNSLESKKTVLVGDNLNDVELLHEFKSIQNNKDLAYVIFTSGSTGIPKGVMIDHQGAVNTILDINERFNLTDKDKVLALSSLSFDLSVFDIFGLLSVGGTIVIPDHNERRNPNAWLDYIEHKSITIWNTVPALMQMLVSYTNSSEALNSLRLILLSGDWIPVELPNKIRNLNKNTRIISLGGATEASIWSIFYEIENVDPSWSSIPYGKPLSNQKFYILKKDFRDCPDYVPGDIYIGGMGLAKGYWNDHVKTNESFIINPQTGERLYKTGDIGRYMADGNIEFLGRDDNQVKIQGYRIELGEIESALLKNDYIKECAVVAKSVNKVEKELVAYVVPNLDSISKSEGENVGELVHADNTIKDKNERTIFKLKKLGLRRLEVKKHSFPLKKRNNNFIHLNEVKNVNCKLENISIGLNDLGLILESISQQKFDEHVLPKYFYPSAGSLYPVQAYIAIKDNTFDELEGGYYYYNPENHSLDQIFSYCENKHSEINEFEHGDLLIYLIADLRAIRPLYGKFSEEFCFQEAGYMVNLLVNSQYTGGFLNKIEISNWQLLVNHFDLSSEHLLMQAFAISDWVGTENNEYSVFKNQCFSKKEEIILDKQNYSKSIQLSCIERKSYREFKSNEIITREQLSFVLSGINILLNGWEKCKNLLSVYLYIKKGKIEDIEEGIYYFNIHKFKLERINKVNNVVQIFNGNERIYGTSGFAMFFTAKVQKELTVIWNNLMLLTGYLGQNIMNYCCEQNIGLCAIGVVNQSASQEQLGIGSSEEVIHSFIGGKISKEQKTNLSKPNDNQVPKTSVQVITDYLMEKLPLYMIPKHFISIEELPLSPNGKVDRKKLPEPEIIHQENHITPSNDVEKKLARIWSDLLEIPIEKISTNANFFDLGGNSIKIIEFYNGLKTEFNTDIKLEDLFRFTDIISLSNRLDDIIVESSDDEQLQIINSIVDETSNILNQLEE